MDQDKSLPGFEEIQAAERSLLADLLESSRLYRTSRDYLELLQFTARLRNFAPFNAMLIQVQKPGLRFAASAYDSRLRFGRTIKEGARPLLILVPFGPVALVYDVADTEGADLPADVQYAFRAAGSLTPEAVSQFTALLAPHGIDVKLVPAGDGSAGSIRPQVRTVKKGEKPAYRLRINQTQDPNVQFATLAHELAHLYLGHLGADFVLDIPDRRATGHVIGELEAESVSYLVCARSGIESKAETYLHGYVSQHTTIEGLDLHTMLRAAGQIERVLHLTEHTRFGPKVKAKSIPS